MSALIDRSHPAYAHRCPTCEQRPWAPCLDQRYRGTRHLATPHPARRALVEPTTDLTERTT